MPVIRKVPTGEPPKIEIHNPSIAHEDRLELLEKERLARRLDQKPESLEQPLVAKAHDHAAAAAAVPPENQPPLLVDSDRVRSRQVAAQLLEMIAGRQSQILIGRRVVDHLELAEEPAFEVGRDHADDEAQAGHGRRNSG